MMLKHGLAQARVHRGLSARWIAGELGYKQAVVLSHMASGRVAIPLEKVTAIADEVGIDASAFLLAAIEQRVPGAADLLDSSYHSTALADGFVDDLSAIAGRSLAGVDEEVKRILREVVADPNPSRRWLSLAELPVMLFLRTRFPNLASEGLPASARAELERVSQA
jgi:hypothetical protein